MKIKVIKSKIGFGGQVTNVDTSKHLAKDEVDEIEKAMNELTVLVFKNQKINDFQQIHFSKYFGEIEFARNNTNITKNNQRRLSDSFGDVSNLDKNNKPFKKSDNRRYFALGNRLWHTDASYKKIPVKYSILSGRKVAKKGGETQFADMRSAYYTLKEDLKKQIDDMVCEHSLIYSRSKLGFMIKELLTKKEIKNFFPVKQPMVRVNNFTGKKSLYLASHIGKIQGWDVPDSILFINDLIEHSTQKKFIYTHKWNDYDLVMWDNRQVMHRGLSYNDLIEIRDMRRTTISGTEILIDQ